jgi:hypothetical protein
MLIDVALTNLYGDIPTTGFLLVVIVIMCVRPGWAAPEASQQRVSTSEEEADQETDEEIGLKVKGHLAQTFAASDLATAEGISLSEALQRVSRSEQESNKQEDKRRGTSDALANTNTVV